MRLACPAFTPCWCASQRARSRVARGAGGVELDGAQRVGELQRGFGDGLQEVGADTLQHGVDAQAVGGDVDDGQVGVDAGDDAGAGERIAACLLYTSDAADE